MQLPNYFLPRPPLNLSPATLATFARLYAEAVQLGHGEPLDYRLDTPNLHYSRGPRGTVPGTAGILAGKDAGGVGPRAAARQGRPALSDAQE